MVFSGFGDKLRGFGRERNRANDRELQLLLDELQEPKSMENFAQRIKVCEQALLLTSQRTKPFLWAGLQDELAQSLCKNPLDGRAENLEEAIRCYEAALQVRTRETLPTEWAGTQNNLGNAYRERILDDRAQNLETAIRCYQAALQVHTRETLPMKWALTQTNLGNAYRERILNDRAQNLETAIGCYQAALQEYTREALPIQWALTQNNLGIAYAERVRGDRAENLEEAIRCYQAALQVRSRETLPAGWAMTQENLGSAYVERVRGDRAQNLEEAIRCFQAALQVRTREELPVQWAGSLTNLGSAYAQRIRDDRAQNLEEAIRCFQAALQEYTREALPIQWALTQNNLGNAYGDRILGDQADNLEEAIRCYQAALQVRTRETLPIDWAMTQIGLGNAYRERVLGDRWENLEEAIRCFQAALQVHTRETLPIAWALTQANLGNAYVERVRGDRAENLEEAIRCFQAALQVHTRETLPIDWALTQDNLGNAYSERIEGDRADNLEEAIRCFQTALQVRTREALPIAWALTQNNLGLAYVERIRGDRAENLEEAIRCYRAALQVRTREALPTGWAGTQNNLGNAYVHRVRGDHKENLGAAIGCYWSALEVYQADTRPNDSRRTARNLGGACCRAERWREAVSAFRIALDAAEILYQASLLGSSRQAELAESSDVAAWAAYALAQTGEVGEAVVVLERGRARELGDALDRDRAELEGVARHDPEAYETYLQAGERLRKIQAVEHRGDSAGEAIRAGAGVLSSGADQQARRVAEQRSADEARVAVADLAAAVERIRRIPGLEAFLSQPDLGKVAKALVAGTPLAYLVCTAAGSLTLLVYQAEGTALAVEAIWTESFAAPDLIALLVTFDGDEVTGGYLPGQLGDQVWLEDALIEALPMLGTQLAGSLAARLSELDCTGVVLVACGHLGLLPLHAASYRRGDTQLCLLDEFDVSYAPSARVLTTARSGAQARDDLPAVLAGVGNPLSHLTPLAFAQAELEEIATCFTHAHPFYEEEATKEALLDAARGATYVHLSCHGQYDPAEPLSSRLHLAGRQSLSLSEILAHRPFGNARLVVASACQTAITDFTRLPDEAIGLPAGFLSAGTPGVVGTLWPVNDLSTALLMAQFYRYHLQGDPVTEQGPMTPARALRCAQRWLARVSAGELAEYVVAHSGLPATAARLPEAVAAMATTRFSLDDPHARPFSSPYHWAPFIFVGA